MSAPSDLLLPSKARRSAAPQPAIALGAIAGRDPVIPYPAIASLLTTDPIGGVPTPIAQSAVAAAIPGPPTVPPDQSTVLPRSTNKIKINPTKRTLRFIVPVTDGPTYLGDITLAVAPDDSLAVQGDRLLQMLQPILKPEVFTRLKNAAAAKAEISEQTLASEQITLNYDSEKLALAIGIPVAARRNESMSLRGASLIGKETLQPANFSGFINFRSAMDFVEHGEPRGILAPVSAIDGAIRAAGVVAESEGYLSFRPGDPLFRRTGSRLVYDDLDDLIRFTAGDLDTLGRTFQSTPTVAGISLSRSYSVLEPWEEFRSTGSQSFTLQAPSMVETIVNGRSVERKLLQPGNYTLQDFPLAEGANNVRLIIQDDAGKQRVVDFNLYSTQQLLEPGLTEFSAFAGVYSTPTAAGIDYSRQWAASGFVRKGISQQFTAGVNMQADAKAQQVGGEILFGSDFGLFGVDLAVSRRTDGGYGFAGDATYQKVIQSYSGQRSLSLDASVEVRSAHFATPGALVDREPVALRGSFGFAWTLGRDTFVSLDTQYARDRVQKDTTYGVRLSGGLSISETMAFISDLELNKSAEGRDDIIRIGIRKRLGPRGQAQADIDNHGEVHTSYQASNGVGIGSWSSSVDVDRTTDGVNVNAQGTLLTNRMELGISQFGGYSVDGGDISDMRTTLRMGTSISFADGVFAIGRPIQQAFLIADPHSSLHGKNVLVDPQQKSEDAKSDGLGGAVDGDLSAYSPRTLIYDVPDAPPGYDIGAGNVQITPPYKAGYHLQVGSDYHLMVIGRLLDRNGEPVALLAGKAIDLRAPKHPAITMFTSRGGKFGAQGLRPGKWRIEMPTDGGPTTYEVEIKDDPSGTVRLGDIRPLAAGGAR